MEACIHTIDASIKLSLPSLFSSLHAHTHTLSLSLSSLRAAASDLVLWPPPPKPLHEALPQGILPLPLLF
jgi:hypothetical protein